MQGRRLLVLLALLLSCSEKENTGDTAAVDFTPVEDTGTPGDACGPVARLDRTDLQTATAAASFQSSSAEEGRYETVALLGDLGEDGGGLLAIGAPQGEANASGGGWVGLWSGPLSPGGYGSDDAVLVVGGTEDVGLGSALDGGVDVDGDGLEDLGLGGAAGDSVMVLLSSELDWSSAEGAPHTSFAGGGSKGMGSRLDLSPDINGDGIGELVFPAPLDEEGGAGAGAIYAALGPMTGGLFDVDDAALKWVGDEEGGLTVVVGAGDFTGDGYGDLAIGAPAATVRGKGRTWILPGGADLTGGASVDASAQRLDTASAYFDQSFAPAGDVNGDSVADLFVGYGEEENGAFSTALYWGGDDLDSEFRWTQGNAESGLAQSMSSGDVDGDGTFDLVMGGQEAELTEGDLDYGVGLLSYVDTDSTGEQASFRWDEPDARLGASVDIANDISGDGAADLAISAPGVGSGTVFVLSGCW